MCRCGIYLGRPPHERVGERCWETRAHHRWARVFGQGCHLHKESTIRHNAPNMQAGVATSYLFNQCKVFLCFTVRPQHAGSFQGHDM